MKINKERRRKLKASLANIALVLSIFVVIFPLTVPTVSAAGDWYYVGGTGPDNYTKIRDAIDEAGPYDFIYVYPGTYNEILSIVTAKHNLTLIGEERDITIIDAKQNGTVISISASWVNVTGFT